MKQKLLNYFCLFFLMAFVAGCEDDKDKEIFTPKAYKVTGNVEKGPFINGSKITAQALDENYNLTGQVYQSIVVEDDGSFNLGEIKLNSPYVLLTADGYYFNEVYGELSTGQISMQSLVNLTANKQANINVLTHLKAQRMMQLLKNSGLAFDEADKQVQKEVLKNFGLERYAEKDVCNFSIASGTEEAGALIVVSSTLLRERTDAELTEYLAKLSAEFKAEGTFTENTKKDLRESSILLRVDDIADHIISRYKKILGIEVTVPNLNYFIDWDGDGIAGNEPDAGEKMELTLDKTEVVLPAEGGTVRVKINCKVPVTLEKPAGMPESTTSEERFSIFKYTNMEYTKAIEGDELIITAKPARGALMAGGYVTVYTPSGRTSTRLIVSQLGDQSKQVELGEDGLLYIGGIVNQMLVSMQDFSNLDGYYTQSFEPVYSFYRPFYDHTITPYDGSVFNIWRKAYTPLSIIGRIGDMLQRGGVSESSSFMVYLHQLGAIQHFQLASWWENVAYTFRYDDPIGGFKQLGSTDLFAIYMDDLNHCAEYSSLVPGKFDTVESILYPPRAASQALLAKMYLHQKSYAQAYEHLRQIIDSGVYALELSSHASLARDSKELIWGLLMNSQQASPENVLKENDYVPFVTFTEVLLSASECAYRMGNAAEALNYLNRVRQARALPTVSEAGFIESLRATWQSELKGFGSYFAFLRRNDLAIGQLGIQGYQQFLPIPQQEIDSSNGALVQNDGWKKKDD